MSRPADPPAEASLRSALVARLAEVQARIDRSAARAGRDPKQVRLVVVSKSATPEQAVAAVVAGARHLGENRIQDAEPRIAAVSAAGLTPSWHMIGHLQRNKVAPALDRFDRLDSIDSLRLAQRVDRIAGERGRSIPVLLQVNVAGDPAKQGLPPAELPELAAAVAALAWLRVEGLMTIVFRDGDTEQLRAAFAAMRALQARLRQALPELPWRVLSMGMSQDLELAVEEGSTEVRVGRAIFAGLPAERAHPEEL